MTGLLVMLMAVSVLVLLALRPGPDPDARVEKMTRDIASWKRLTRILSHRRR